MIKKVAEQMKSGRLTLVQFVVGLIVTLGGVAYSYNRSSNERAAQNAVFELRLSTIEKTIAANQSNVLITRAARNLEIKELNTAIQKNAEDINILKTQFQYLKR
jgi:uncharacterized membrane protein